MSFKTLPDNLFARTRKGIALFLVVGMVFITFLLFFFMSLTTGQFNFTAHQHLETELASQAGRAFADAFWVFAKDVFQNRKGCDRIYPAPGTPSPLYPFNKTGLEKIEIGIEDFEKSGQILNAFKEIEKQIPELSKTKAKMHFKVRKSSDSFAHGDLCLNITFTLKNEDYSFDYFREFKLIRCLAPVVPKFSLFLRNNSGDNSYNRIIKSFQDEQGQEKAFVVSNHETAYVSGATDTWKRSGWIFLGGQSVTLNLDGTHPCRKESDSFMFWPGLYSDSLSQALPYSCSNYIGSSKLRVRFTPSGAMSDWQSSALLKEVLGGVSMPFVLKSSVLRLFGNRDKITPTKVFGRVFTNYVIYSTMILDQNNDSVADSITSPQGVEQRAIFPLPRLDNSGLFKPPIFPRFVTNKGYDLFLDSTGVEGIPEKIEDVFASYNGGDPDYVTYMSKLVRDFSPSTGIEAYNSLYDQIFEGSSETSGKSFPAPHMLTQNSYPDEGKDVEIPLDYASTELQFKGDLNKFDPGAFFADLNIYGRIYTDENDFFKNSEVKRENETFLINDPIVSRVSGSLTIANPVQANAPAVIVCDDDLTVSDIIESANESKLTLVSLNGDIKITGKRLEGISLIAPRGEIFWEAPVEINGSLCARNIAPATFGLGGSLTWDKGMDISSVETAARSVAILIGPNITLVRKAY